MTLASLRLASLLALFACAACSNDDDNQPPISGSLTGGSSGVDAASEQSGGQGGGTGGATGGTGGQPGPDSSTDDAAGTDGASELDAGEDASAVDAGRDADASTPTDASARDATADVPSDAGGVERRTVGAGCYDIETDTTYPDASTCADGDVFVWLGSKMDLQGGGAPIDAAMPMPFCFVGSDAGTTPVKFASIDAVPADTSACDANGWQSYMEGAEGLAGVGLVVKTLEGNLYRMWIVSNEPPSLVFDLAPIP